MRPFPYQCGTVLVAIAAVLAAAARTAIAAGPVNFRRDIRPILSDNCYTCHGQDEQHRKAGLRLDTKEGAIEALKSGKAAIIPGKSGESALFNRVSATDESDRMPPADSGKSLTKGQVELIRRWIDEGADWQRHWSFVVPERPASPATQDTSWARNPIDAFILSRLEQEGLQPAPEADKATLIRRVTFDLTGLPPTLDEVDAFLADTSPEAYERLVDRLLASPRYGEHRARYWLDAARYGDTHGLHLDNRRSIWPYRDWVISAFNKNTPFDQFTVEQLAGDLLPDPTLKQRIATGFNRCNISTSEGGSIDEEYRVRYAVDRVETTSTVWLGLTMGCAVCHEHKFDPFSQKDFYKLFAYFGSVTERPMDGNRPDPPPVVRVPGPDQSAALAVLGGKILAARNRLDTAMPAVDAAQAVWQKAWEKRIKDQWEVLDPIGFLSTGGASLQKLDDKSVLAGGFAPDKDVYEVVMRTDRAGLTALRLEALTHESLPHKGPGRSSNANLVLSEFEAEARSVKDQNQVQKVRFAVVQADHSQKDGGFVIESAIDGKVDARNGWAVTGYERREDRTAVFVASKPFGFEGGTILRVRMRHESDFTQHAIGRFRLAVSTDATMLPATLGTWHAVGPFDDTDGREAYKTAHEPERNVDLNASYGAGALKWVAKPDFTDGQVNELTGGVCATYLYRTINAPSPRQMTLSLGSNDALKVWLNGTVVLDKNVQRGVKPDQDRITIDLNAGENRLLMKVVNYGANYAFYFRVQKDHGGGEALTLSPILATPAEKRSDEQKKALRDYYRRNYSPEFKKLEGEVARLSEQEKQTLSKIPTTMVMQDLAKPRDTHVLVRGEYDKRGDKVDAGVLELLAPVPGEAKGNRMDLARWIVSPSQPLTARVTVNRFWQQYFGTGIVKTAENFGSQGDFPTHPALLDWLATEFVASGWDVRHMHRLIVTSATYRQCSNVTPEKYGKDRDNRLLARGPRFRLDAEMVRDNALAVSGLLVERVGGPSVKPYQPLGLWKAVGYTSSNTANFVKDEGEKLYRRSMYTFWKRTSPPPSMLTFDAPSREACTVRRARTNTPLQALALMNDVQFVEAARRFAERMMTEGGTSPEDRVRYAFRLATARAPRSDEMQVLRATFERHLAQYRKDAAAAASLLEVGDSKPPAEMDRSELAAWTMMANLILNLDETVTKG